MILHTFFLKSRFCLSFSLRFTSPNSAQNSTLALNMLSGFFLALTVPGGHGGFI